MVGTQVARQNAARVKKENLWKERGTLSGFISESVPFCYRTFLSKIGAGGFNCSRTDIAVPGSG